MFAQIGHLADVLRPGRRDGVSRANPPPTKELTMTKLIADMSMSLDGKIADPDDDATMLFDWFFGGDTEVGPFRVSEQSAELLKDAFGSIGALIGGRRYFDLAEGWGGNHPMGVPVYILTHEPPADWPEDSTIRFVTDGLESAVAQATEAAQGRDIGVATPSLVRQCLDAGVLDELQINVVPLVMGEGKPYFEGIRQHVPLEGPEVIEGSGVTHLRYRVSEGDATADAATRERAKEVAQPGR
jgi:dihydrofolate reductase